MNSLERKMVEVLIDLRENHSVNGVKAEFEAEGTRLEEAMRLKEVVSAAGIGLTIKIGGCEALRDMYECRVLGVARIVAPMIESAYAMHKYIGAVKLAFPEEERSTTDFAINVETLSGFKVFDDMLALPDAEYLDGIVLGRVDLTGSMGLSRNDINSSKEVMDICRTLFTKAKAAGLETALGGGVSAETIPFIHEVGADLVDRFETRKVIFCCQNGLPASDADKGILKAVGFELMWLKNKRDFYSSIATEDATRLEMLQSRYDKLIMAAGGMYE
ncbi:MAG: aldolase/citrate lyase family protein [Coriobacteriia bacterium]|nr:aldolase/citrate lyase family protein [Coriobacteriia bacterium]